MRPRRTPYSNGVFSLEGGTEDNDLWVQRDELPDGTPFIRSCWVFTPTERDAIAAGANVELSVMGSGHPPVELCVVTYPVGRGSAPPPPPGDPPPDLGHPESGGGLGPLSR
jgi:hypothetical protein